MHNSSPTSSPDQPPRPPPSRTRRARAPSPHPQPSRRDNTPAVVGNTNAPLPDRSRPKPKRPAAPAPVPTIPASRQTKRLSNTPVLPPLPRRQTSSASNASTSTAYVTALSRNGSASTAVSESPERAGAAKLPQISEGAEEEARGGEGRMRMSVVREKERRKLAVPTVEKEATRSSSRTPTRIGSSVMVNAVPTIPSRSSSLSKASSPPQRPSREKPAPALTNSNSRSSILNASTSKKPSSRSTPLRDLHIHTPFQPRLKPLLAPTPSTPLRLLSSLTNKPLPTAPPTLLVHSPPTSSPDKERKIRRKPAPPSREGTPSPAPASRSATPVGGSSWGEAMELAGVVVERSHEGQMTPESSVQGTSARERVRSTPAEMSRLRMEGMERVEWMPNDRDMHRTTPGASHPQSNNRTPRGGSPCPVPASPSVSASPHESSRRERSRLSSYRQASPSSGPAPPSPAPAEAPTPFPTSPYEPGKRERTRSDGLSLALGLGPEENMHQQQPSPSRPARSQGSEFDMRIATPQSVPVPEPQKRERTRSIGLSLGSGAEGTTHHNPPLPSRTATPQGAANFHNRFSTPRAPTPQALPEPEAEPVGSQSRQKRDRERTRSAGFVLHEAPPSPGPVASTDNNRPRSRSRSNGTHIAFPIQGEDLGMHPPLPLTNLLPALSSPAAAPRSPIVVAHEERARARARTRSGGLLLERESVQVEVFGAPGNKDRQQRRERTRSAGGLDNREIEYARMQPLPASPMPPQSMSPAPRSASRASLAGYTDIRDENDSRRERTRTWSTSLGLTQAGTELFDVPVSERRKSQGRERTRSAGVVLTRNELAAGNGVDTIGKRGRTKSGGHVLLGEMEKYTNSHPPVASSPHLSKSKFGRDPPATSTYSLSSSPYGKQPKSPARNTHSVSSSPYQKESNQFSFDPPLKPSYSPAPAVNRTPRRSPGGPRSNSAAQKPPASFRLANPSSSSSEAEDADEDEIARHRAEALAALSSQPSTPHTTPHKATYGVTPKRRTVHEQRADALRSQPSGNELGLGLGLKLSEDSEVTVIAVDESVVGDEDVEYSQEDERQVIDSLPPTLQVRTDTASDLRTPMNRFSGLFEALNSPYTPPLSQPAAPSPNLVSSTEEIREESDQESEGSVWEDSVDEEEGDIVWGGVLEDDKSVLGAGEPEPSPFKSGPLQVPATKAGLSSISSMSSLAWSGAEEVEKSFNAATQRLFAGIEQDLSDSEESGLDETKNQRDHDATPRMPDCEAMQRTSDAIDQIPDEEGLLQSILSPSLHASGTPEMERPPTFSASLHRTWRSTLSTAAFSSLSDRYGSLEMHRQELIWELTVTESAFVQAMRLVIRLFVQPLRIQPTNVATSRSQPPTWMPGVPSEVARLFDWLDDIVQLHAEIASILHSARASQYPIVLSCAAHVVPLVPKLEVHQPYLVRLEEVTTTIERLMKEPKSEFGEFVRIQSASKEWGGLSLGSWLLKPVQRLLKYPLFFKQLWESTPRAHQDHLASFSLLHSTDSIIRVMQDVKGDEEEYQSVQTLSSRIAGLPRDFQLATRSRRLIAQGLLHRLEFGEKEKGLLESGEASVNSVHRNQMGGPASYDPDYGYYTLHRLSAYSSTPSEGSSPDWPPSNWQPSTSSSSYPLTPALTVSSLTTEPDFNSVNAPSRSPSTGRRPAEISSRSSSFRAAPRVKPRESPVYAFVFTDLIVLTSPICDGHPLLRTPKAADSRKAEWRLLTGIGLSRVLAVTDHSLQLGYDHLIGIEVLPFTNDPRLMLDSSTAVTLYLTFPERFNPRDPIPTASALAQARQKWFGSFEQALAFTIKSLTFPSVVPFQTNLEDDTSCGYPHPASQSEGDHLPKSPSSFGHQATSAVEHERGERDWWAHKFRLAMLAMRRKNSSDLSALPSLSAPKLAERPESSELRRKRISGINQGEVLPFMLTSTPSTATMVRADSRRSVMSLLSRKGR